VSTASRRRGVATTPSTQFEVRKWKETTPSQHRCGGFELYRDITSFIAETGAVALQSLSCARRVLDVDDTTGRAIFQ
jgi:hypothetical protein